MCRSCSELLGDSQWEMGGAGAGLQAAAEGVEDDGVGVAMVLVVPRYDDDGFGVFGEPSQTFVKPANGDACATAASYRAGRKGSPLAVLHLVHDEPQKIHDEQLQEHRGP